MESIRACSVPECNRTDRITKGFCGTHYARFRKHGSPGSSAVKVWRYEGSHCVADGCVKPARSNGLCVAHYKRVLRSGTVDGYQPQPIREYMIQRTKLGAPPADRPALGACHLWVGTVGANGYGCVNLRPRRLAHRVAFELARGEIPHGLHLDHLCRVRTCVNPAHLEPVTNEENLRRGLGFRLRNGMDFRCIHGHEYTTENTYRNPNNLTDIRCRACARMHNRKRAEIGR